MKLNLKYISKDVLRDIRRPFLLSNLLVLSQPAAALVVSYLIKLSFDQIIPNEQLDRLLGIAALMLLIQGWVLASAVVSQRLTANLVQSVSAHLQQAAMAKLYRLPTEQREQLNSGVTHSIAIEYPRRITYLGNALCNQLLPSTLLCVVLLAILIISHGILAFVLPICLPIFYVIGYPLQRQLIRAVQSRKRINASWIQEVARALQLLPLVTILQTQDLEQARQKSMIQSWTQAYENLAFRQAEYRQVQGALLALLSIVLLLCGGAAVIQGYLSQGELISFYFLNGLLMLKLKGVLTSIPNILDGLDAWQELVSFLDLKIAPIYTGQKPIDFKGAIAFKDISFQYDRTPVLQNIDLQIAPQTMVVITGVNGSGKTTLLKLLLGLYRPHQGQVFADGIPFSDLDILSLRKQMGIVLQEPLLYPATILENVTYGYPEASAYEIQRAMKLAQVDQVCETLPEREQTPVGDNGKLLSGGERQRIAIARSLIKQPRLLILDEPTNHLDRPSVTQILQNLRALPDRPTIIIISHDREVLDVADCIYHLSKGRITQNV